MPVMVVGADTRIGAQIVDALIAPGREVRAFVSDVESAARLKAAGVKVAVGDVSDPSHVGAACTNCFSAVLITEAASDGRERAFASGRSEVLRGWADAVADADVTRVIWVDDANDLPPTGIDQTFVVEPAATAAADVALIDDASTPPADRLA